MRTAEQLGDLAENETGKGGNPETARTYALLAIAAALTEQTHATLVIATEDRRESGAWAILTDP